MRATICLPTYNEIDNLEAMVDALSAVLREGDRVLVIDDASPDGTGELADRLAASHRPSGRAAPPAEGGARTRVHRGLPSSARRRRRTDRRDGL